MLTAIAVALALLSCAAPTQAPNPVVLEHVPQELKNLTLHSMEVYETSASFACWDQGFVWNFGESEIRWQRHERPNTAAAWSDSLNTFTTSFEISAACWRKGGDDAFVAGLKATGEVVLERWSFPERTGRWHHVPPAMQPLGTPMGPYVGTTEIKGGTWVAPPATHPSPQRRVILETSAIQLVRAMEADPEGRFVLFTDHATGSLFRMRLDQGNPSGPELLFTAAQVPALAKTVWINVADVAATGKRLWLLSEPDDHTKQKGHTARVLLWDDNNDGNFESTQTLEWNEFRATYLSAGVCVTPWKKL